MSSGDVPANDSTPAAPGGKASARWRRKAGLTLGILALGALLFFAVSADESGGEQPLPPIDEPPPPLPLPPPEHKDVMEEARGFYGLRTRTAHFLLELGKGHRFQFLSERGEERRQATGTWNLVGMRLTLHYEKVDGKPFKGPPITNIYRGDSIELRQTGQNRRIVLRKRTVLRPR